MERAINTSASRRLLRSEAPQPKRASPTSLNAVNHVDPVWSLAFKDRIYLHQEVIGCEGMFNAQAQTNLWEQLSNEVSHLSQCHLPASKETFLLQGLGSVVGQAEYQGGLSL